MVLEINSDEREMLAALVQRELDELGPEIHHTRTNEYREDLKIRKDMLVRLMDRLAAPQPAGR